MKALAWIALFALVPCVVAVPAAADLVAYEGFDYTTPNPVAGLNGGTGAWSGAWADLNAGGGHTFDVVTPGEQYTDGSSNELVVSGNAMIEDEQNTGASTEGSNYRRSFDNTGLYGDGTDIWITYIVNINGSGSHGAHFASSDGNFGTQVSRTSGDVWRLQVGGTGVNSAINSSGQTLVLLNIDFLDAADSDTVSVWFNPDLTSEPALGTADLQLTGQNIGNNSQFRFFAGNFPTSVTYDEIRIATDFRSAAPLVPEPASLALVGLGGLVMLRRRRA